MGLSLMFLSVFQLYQSPLIDEWNTLSLWLQVRFHANASLVRLKDALELGEYLLSRSHLHRLSLKAVHLQLPTIRGHNRLANYFQRQRVLPALQVASSW
ncbi:hypothetical protein JB92DRAFT_2032073 [Gautieria morchelliformis]|nr:hypothetical protein JB92DRAFT_2032073 [Gautieria morchelliformis]